MFAIVKNKGQVRQLKVTLTPHKIKEKKKRVFSIINSEFYETAVTLF